MRGLGFQKLTLLTCLSSLALENLDFTKEAFEALKSLTGLVDLQVEIRSPHSSKSRPSAIWRC